MASTRMNVVMTVIGFSVSILFIVFICTRLICARIQLRNSRRSLRIQSRSDLSGVERGLHGLDPSVVANFPVKKYGDEYFSSAENTQCAVCLAEYHEEEVLRILPHCGHYFHINCIDIWLLQHCTCPVCRISLCETNESKRLLPPMFSSRSHGTQSTDMQSYYHLLSGRRFLSRSREDTRTGTSREGQSSVSRNNSEVTGENVSSSESNKHVESPSFA